MQIHLPIVFVSHHRVGFEKPHLGISLGVIVPFFDCQIVWKEFVRCSFTIGTINQTTTLGFICRTAQIIRGTNTWFEILSKSKSKNRKSGSSPKLDDGPVFDADANRSKTNVTATNHKALKEPERSPSMGFLDSDSEDGAPQMAAGVREQQTTSNTARHLDLDDIFGD